MNERSFATDFSVGFVLFVATVVLIATLFVVGDGMRFLSPQVEYKVTLPNAGGLKKDSRVRLSGVPVGSVSEISFPTDLNSSHIVVTLSILKEYMERIREDSYAWIQSEGLLGDDILNVRLGTTDKPPLSPGSMIPFRDRPMLDSLAGTEIRESTTDLIKVMASVLQDINRGEGTFGRLLKDPELYENLNDFTASMAATTKELQTITGDLENVITEVRSQKGTLGKLIFSEDYARSITRTLEDTSSLVADLRQVTSAVKAGEGTVGKLVKDPRLYDSGRNALDGIARASARLDRLIEKAESSQSVLARLATDGATGRSFGELVGRLDRSAESLEKVLGMVERGEGSLGVLVHGPSIAASLRDLFVGVGESGVILNVIRNAEEEGHRASLLKLDLAQREREQVLKARAIAQLRRSGPEAEGTPVPTAAKEGVEEEPRTK